MNRYCLVCRRDFPSDTQSACIQCDLPTIDASAIRAVQEVQIHAALTLVIRRADSDFRALGPGRVIRDWRDVSSPKPRPRSVVDGIMEVVADIVTAVRGGMSVVLMSMQSDGRGR